MMHGTLLRTAGAAFLAVLLLTSPAAFAQGSPSTSPQGGDGGFFALVWSFLTDLLAGGEAPDNRCTIDPDGRSSCVDAGVNLDTRCTIDPDGSCGPGF